MTGSTDGSEIARYEELARRLGVLASPTRLHILHQLRSPRVLRDIRAVATLTRQGERSERLLSKQTVHGHLETLMDAGLVRRVVREDASDGRGPTGPGYLLSHPQLFAMVNEMRNLAKLRPLTELGSVTPTMDDLEVAVTPWRDDMRPPTPQLMVAFGREDGEVYRLNGPAGMKWWIGRDSACDIPFDHDPYLSGRHCTISREEGGTTTAEDLGSRNGTFLNWAPLRRRRPAIMQPGDILTCGRTVLVYQAPPGMVQAEASLRDR